jgi:undecaprenyl diphosphate synthase
MTPVFPLFQGAANMATIEVKNLLNQLPRHMTALGNSIVEHYPLAVDAAGKVNAVDLATGDIIRLGFLPAGWKLLPASAEIVITDVFWPDFRRPHLEAAIGEYQRRHRRFGGL